MKRLEQHQEEQQYGSGIILNPTENAVFETVT